MFSFHTLQSHSHMQFLNIEDAQLLILIFFCPKPTIINFLILQQFIVLEIYNIKMIQITHKITTSPGVRVEYRSYDDGHVKLIQQKNKAIYFHREPILNIQQPKKRSSSYLKLQNQKPINNFQTRSEMRQSNLSKLNQELQERTNYFTRHGKYDSKWTQQHHDNFKSTERSSSSHSGGSSRYRPVTIQHRPDQYYRPPSTQVDPLYIPTSHEPEFNSNPRVGHYITSYNVSPSNLPSNPQISKNVYEAAYTAAQAKQKVKESAKDVADGVTETANAVYETASDAKDIVKDQAKVAGRQVKQNAKQATKAVVGHENYSLLSTIKNAFTNLFKNAMAPIVEAKDVVVDQAKVAKDVVADQAKNAKDAVQDGARDAKDAVQDGARDAKYAVQDGARDAKYAVDYGVRDAQYMQSNYALSQPRYSSEFKDSRLSSQHSFKVQQPMRFTGNQMSYKQVPHYVTKSPYVNDVSPIEYSKRQFSRPPTATATYFWIYMLLAMGVFLVIFQIVK